MEAQRRVGMWLSGPVCLLANAVTGGRERRDRERQDAVDTGARADSGFIVYVGGCKN